MSLFTGAFLFWKKGRSVYRGPPFSIRGSANDPPKGGAMVIFVAVKLKKLFKKKRNYSWPRPESCPRCNDYKVWGHGYTQAIFDGYNEPLLLKLYRCPVCGCVIRLRPSGYFKRFQAKIKTIRSCISHKEKHNKWLSGIPPTRQRHWFRSLQRRIKAYLSDTWTQGLVKAFDHFMTLGHVPVTRSI